MGDIVWFDELRASDVKSAGGKGANLGELTHAEFPVPPGYVVTAPAYLQAMDDAGVRSELVEVAAGVDPDDAAVLAATSDRLQELVRKAGVPASLRARVLEAYEQLGGGRVAVRSSGTSEDTAAASFAGMNQTFTNVTGAEQLLSRLVDCWASLFGRASSPIDAHAASQTNPRSRSSSKRWWRRNAAASCSPPIRRRTTRATS